MSKIEFVLPNFLQGIPGTTPPLTVKEKETVVSFMEKQYGTNYSVNKSIESLLFKLNSVTCYEKIPDTILFSYGNLISRNLNLKDTFDVVNLTVKLAAARFNKKHKEVLFTGCAGIAGSLDDHYEQIVSAGFLGCTTSPVVYSVEIAAEDVYRHKKDPTYWSPIISSKGNKKIIVPATTPLEITLTFRQEQIFNMVCKGMTNYQIAKRLGLSESTVKMHIGIVFKKYGVRDRSQLIFSLKEKIG
jgi:DNA-binding CsgD family transcriptional regulator